MGFLDYALQGAAATLAAKRTRDQADAIAKRRAGQEDRAEQRTVDEIAHERTRETITDAQSASDRIRRQAQDMGTDEERRARTDHTRAETDYLRNIRPVVETTRAQAAKTAAGASATRAARPTYSSTPRETDGAAYRASYQKYKAAGKSDDEAARLAKLETRGPDSPTDQIIRDAVGKGKQAAVDSASVLLRRRP